MGIEGWPKSGAALVTGETFHARRGGPANAFRYNVDFVLLKLHPQVGRTKGPLMPGRRGIVCVLDRDHGGGTGSMTDWAIGQAVQHGLPGWAMTSIWLLTQPRVLGYVFNPVSFWFFADAEGALRAVLAEVNNTFGDRHSYLCALPDWQPISAQDRIQAAKVFHVSPFQEVAGTYEFSFDLQPDRLSVAIEHRRETGASSAGGVVATLAGTVAPLTRKGVVGMLMRRPFGSMRVSALIYWQALRLKLKGAPYRVRPLPPSQETSR